MNLKNLPHARPVSCMLCRTGLISRFLVIISLLSLSINAVYAQALVIGHNQAHLEDLKSVPVQWIDSAKAKLLSQKARSLDLAFIHLKEVNGAGWL